MQPNFAIRQSAEEIKESADYEMKCWLVQAGIICRLCKHQSIDKSKRAEVFSDCCDKCCHSIGPSGDGYYFELKESYDPNWAENYPVCATCGEQLETEDEISEYGNYGMLIKPCKNGNH